MEGSLLNHIEQKQPRTMQKYIFACTLLLILFQILLMMFIFGFGYITNDTYSKETERIVSLAIDETTKTFEKHKEELQGTIKSEGKLPPKFLTPHQLPRYSQYNRGTCWAVATIGLLEQSYRANGIKKGFLNEDEYVRLSSQAYAIDVLNECAIHPEACPGKSLYNSTEGGYIEWLYAFKSIYDKVLPEAACPYQEENNGQWVCENKEEKQSNNPIKFDVTGITVKRTIEEVKQLLVETNKPVGFDSSLIIGEFAIPSANHDLLRAFVTSVDSCPDDIGKECLYLPQNEMNANGEFFIEEVKALSEGGHAMNIVGYNDDFVNKDGTKGAFIVRNSWLEAEYNWSSNSWNFPQFKQEKRGDEPPPTPRNYYRGSHSQQYVLHEHSEWDERTVCPNPNNIQNWDSCINLATGPIKKGDRAEARIDVETSVCFNETYMFDYVKNYRRPMEFRCLNQFSNELCSEEDLTGSRFFLVSKSQSVHNPNLVNFCMLKVNATDPTIQKEVCVTEVPFDHVDYLFIPIQRDMEYLKNNPDHCGFHIWPYSYIEKNLKYRGFFDVIQLDIVWDDSSYEKNRDKYPEFNYDYIHQSTNKQTPFPQFLGPEPYQKRYYD